MMKNILCFSHGKTIMFALFVAIFFVGRKIWRMEFPITKTNFSDITLGIATAKNIDIQQLVVWYELYVVVLGLLFAYFVHRLGYYEKITGKIKSLVSRIEREENEYLFFCVIVLGLILMGGQSLLSWSFALSIVLSCIYLHKFNPLAEKKQVLSACVTAIWIFSIPCIYIGVLMGADITYILALFNVSSVLYLCYRSGEENFYGKIQAALFPFMLAAILSFVVLGTMEILLVRGYTVAGGYPLLPFIIAVAYVFFFGSKPNRDYSQFNFYGTLVLMIAALLPPLGQSFPIDFFEGANHGVSIEEFILGMGLPFFHNLDAHMLYWILPALVYYFFTGDYTGALFSPYIGVFFALFGTISLVCLFKKFFSNQEILVMLTLSPWAEAYHVFLGFIIFQVFLYWHKKQGIRQGILLMIAFAALALYKIDVGASFGVAILMCPIFYCLGHKKYDVLAKYFLAGIIFAVCSFLIIYRVAVHYDIDIMVTLKSFLTAFSSNQHWGYGVLGEFSIVWWSYFLLPLLISVMIWPYIGRLRKGEESVHDWIVIFLYGAFILNLPRILVRHSLAEKQIYTCTLILVLAGLLFILRMKKNRAAIFSAVFLMGAFSIGGFCTANIMGGYVVNVSAVIGQVYANEHSSVKINDDDMKQITACRDFFDANLEPQETYFDFTNQALFYAFTKRRNPVYINQCPGMINGYNGQKQAIASLEKIKPKFVTMPYHLRGNSSFYAAYTEIDGIINTDRYYLLTDYITDNYRPYCAMGDFAVWCLKSEYDFLCQRDKDNGVEREYLDYTYEPSKCHAHYLGAIPRIWGNCTIDCLSSKKLTALGENSYSVKDEEVLGRKGFITLEIESPKKSYITAQIIGKDVFPVKYDFKIERGIHRYRLQVSSDILWYADKLEEFRVSNGNAQIKNVYFETISGSL